MTITCAIIDDEPLALDLLESYVRRTPFIELKGKYSSAVEALEKTSDSNVDLLFLDIQMPGLSGIEFSRMVAPQTRIIFTTAFEQYALEGFKVNAIDYLMKPISYADFLSAVNKVIKWFDLSHKSNNASGDNAENPNDEENIFVRSEHHLIGIKLSDIQYLESLKDYVLIHIQGRTKPVYTLASLSSMEKSLPKNRFMRVHRSYIIPLQKITMLENDCVIVANKHIPVSKLYRTALQDYIANRTL